MKLLLDTCTFLWLCEGDENLSNHAADLIREPENEVWLSAASAWEIVIKHSLGSLLIAKPPVEYLPEQRALHRVDSLDIDESAVLHISKLPVHHRDPFDRLIVAQAIVHGCTILTPDPLIRAYPARVEWS